MLTRMALLAMLFLALAAPRWVPKTPASNDIQRQPPAMAIILDSSASMLALRDDARQAAMRMFEESSEWECALFAFDQTVLPLELAALNEWRPSHLAGNPAIAIRTALHWLDNYSNSTHRRLVIISDFQRSNWGEMLPGVPRDIEILMHPVETERQNDNVSLTSVQTTSIGDNQLRIRIGWHNWSELPQERTLRIRHGKQELTQGLTLPPHSEGATAFSLEPMEQNSHATAELEPVDGWPADDQWVFWAQREPSVPVLLLLPDGASDGKLADSLEFFLKRALTAERAGASGHFQVNTLGASTLALIELGNFPLVILAGSAERLTDEAIQLLQNYRADGNSIIFIPGSAPVAAWRFLRNADLLAATEQGLIRQTSGIGPLPAVSPLVRIFPPSSPSDLHLFAIRQMLRISPAANDAILLKTLDGQVALLQHQDEHSGSLYAFTFSFALENTDFPITQSFLPILRELCNEATRDHSGILRLKCGEPFPELHAPDGTPFMPPPGATTLQPGLTHLGAHPVEINPPAVESSPATTDLDDLRRVLETTPPDDSDATSDMLPPGNDTARNLQPWCFAGLAILAVLELLLLLSGVSATHNTEKHLFHTLWH